MVVVMVVRMTLFSDEKNWWSVDVAHMWFVAQQLNFVISHHVEFFGMVLDSLNNTQVIDPNGSNLVIVVFDLVFEHTIGING
jgi:hypothetical protein